MQRALQQLFSCALVTLINSVVWLMLCVHRKVLCISKLGAMVSCVTSCFSVVN